MSKRIYISPSSQPENSYAVGGTNEQEQCRKIAAALAEKLEVCGFWVKAGLSGTMYTRAAESDKWGVDLHLPIHTNACNGKVAGLRIMVAKLGGEAEMIARAIDKYLAPVTPGTSDNITAQPQLYEIAATSAVCVYVEVGFHDNPTEAQWIIDNTEVIAEMIARGLCEYYGVTYKEETEMFEDVKTDRWYAADVAYCAENGLMHGDGNGKFRPEENVTRAELAAVAARLHKAMKEA